MVRTKTHRKKLTTQYDSPQWFLFHHINDSTLEAFKSYSLMLYGGESRICELSGLGKIVLAEVSTTDIEP